MPTAQLERIGNYLLRKSVGRGRLGNVYEGIHRTTNQRVAVKVISSNLADDHCCVDCFERNVKAAKELRHPNIVRTKDIGEYEGRYFCTMEFVEGQNLAQYQKEHGAIAPKDALALFEQAADALKHAWRKKVVHGHLTPNNVLITPEGQLKICDFGTAGAHSDVNEDKTEEGFDPCELDPRVDVRALAVLLYGTLIGRPLVLPEGRSIKLSSEQLMELPEPVQALLQRISADPFDPDDLLGSVQEAITQQQEWDIQHETTETPEDEHHVRGLYLYMALGVGILAGIIGMISLGVFQKDMRPDNSAQVVEAVSPFEVDFKALKAALPELIQHDAFVEALASLAELQRKYAQQVDCQAAVLNEAVKVIEGADEQFREMEARALAADGAGKAVEIVRIMAGQELDFLRKRSHRLLLTLHLKWRETDPGSIRISEYALPDAFAMLLRKRDYETARVLCMLAMAQSDAAMPDEELVRWVDWLTDAIEFWGRVEEGAKQAVGRHATFHFMESSKPSEVEGAFKSVEDHSIKVSTSDGGTKTVGFRQLLIDDALRLGTSVLDTTNLSTQRLVGKVLLLDLQQADAVEWLRQAADQDDDESLLNELENRYSLISRILRASEYASLMDGLPGTHKQIAAKELAAIP